MKKKAAALLLTALMAVSAVACGGNADTKSDSAKTDDAETEESGSGDLNYDGDIKVWVADAAVDFTTEQIKDFQSQNPGLKDATFTVEPVGEGDAATNVITDVEGAADVFTFAQDQTARLVSAGGLEEVEDSNAQTIKDENDEGAVTAATVGGKLYAYPITSDNGYFLFYDKSVVSDPSDLDKIAEDCQNAGKNFYYQINSGWYQDSFFFGTGCKLTYDTDDQGNFTSCDADLANDKGVVALKEMIKLASYSSFQDGANFGDATDVGAIVDGTWDAGAIKDAFGDNYACAKLPSFTGADGQTYQLGGFSGYKLLGVKPQEDEDKLAVCDALAKFLSSKDVQIARYKAVGWGPSNLEAQLNEDVQKDEALTALREQQQYDIPQGQYPQEYWDLATALGDDIDKNNVLTPSTSDADLLAALQKFQDTCKSYASK